MLLSAHHSSGNARQLRCSISRRGVTGYGQIAVKPDQLKPFRRARLMRNYVSVLALPIRVQVQ